MSFMIQAPGFVASPKVAKASTVLSVACFCHWQFHKQNFACVHEPLWFVSTMPKNRIKLVGFREQKKHTNLALFSP
jgi:hypothetical protein